MHKIGDKVTWVSQSAGSETRKTGEIVMTAAAAKERPDLRRERIWHHPVRLAHKLFPDHRLMFDGMSWPEGGVMVEVRSHPTSRAKPRLYMPRPRKLDPAA